MSSSISTTFITSTGIICTSVPSITSFSTASTVTNSGKFMLHVLIYMMLPIIVEATQSTSMTSTSTSSSRSICYN